MSRRRLVAALPLLTALAACGTESALPESVGYGAAPQLPEARSGPSSASTAHGTATRPPATRSSSSPSAAASRRVRRRTS